MLLEKAKKKCMALYAYMGLLYQREPIALINGGLIQERSKERGKQ